MVSIDVCCSRLPVPQPSHDRQLSQPSPVRHMSYDIPTPQTSQPLHVRHTSYDRPTPQPSHDRQMSQASHDRQTSHPSHVRHTSYDRPTSQPSHVRHMSYDRPTPQPVHDRQTSLPADPLVVIVYFMCDEPVPYCCRVHSAVVTLRQFKDVIVRKGSFRCVVAWCSKRYFTKLVQRIFK